MISRKTDIQIQIVNKIRELRQEHKISQAQICDIIGLNSAGQVGNIESPKFNQKYTLAHLYLLATHFNYPIEKIFLTKEELTKNTSQVIDILILRLIEYNK